MAQAFVQCHVRMSQENLDALLQNPHNVLIPIQNQQAIADIVNAQFDLDVYANMAQTYREMIISACHFLAVNHGPRQTQVSVKGFPLFDVQLLNLTDEAAIVPVPEPEPAPALAPPVVEN